MPRESAPLVFDRMMAACRAGGLEPRIRQELLHEAGRLRLVADGLGLSFVTSSFEASRPAGTVLRPVADFHVDLTLELIWRRDNASNSLARFVAAMRRITSETQQAAVPGGEQ
jgi:DNA-binding transcriptional LysR family regulator